ncbi:MAG TPA: tRNA pseudouridine(55) synthase TruB [Rhodanobacteraceae bacterium]|nr:tRNA pseudouridine(55) synthase TruB [Rhodanobacteraceae bacterium]
MPQTPTAPTGIILLDKPAGLSSNAALQRVRRLFGRPKAGHTGSLDPLATGLLPICLGEATKVAGLLLRSRKAYQAVARLGVSTDSGDSEGAVLATRPVPALDTATIEAALAPLRGRIIQVPPVYSALKQGGVPLYTRARRGEDVVAPPREVEVQRFELDHRDGDDLHLSIECGTGTYVRSLVRDLGEALGCGAHLVALRRLWVEPFREPDMVTLEALQQMADAGDEPALRACVLPLAQALAHLPQVALDEAEARRFQQGQKLAKPAPAVAVCVVSGPGGALLGLGEIDAAGTLHCRRGFHSVADDG